MIGITQVKAFCKASGVKSILQTTKQEIHGVNPTLTYKPSGKMFELPRFCSVEMKQARNMNKLAVGEVKKPLNSIFSKAAAEDLKRLTSNTVEDSYKRVKWTNPKDGKVYHLLDNGKTEEGKVIVRILDADGAFVKEVKIKPKNIVIADVFDITGSALPHGVKVEAFARRNNPFAIYHMVNFPSNGTSVKFDKAAKVLQDASKTVDADYVSLSIANTLNFKNKRFIPYRDTMKAFTNIKTNDIEEFEKAVTEYTNKKARVLVASGNNGEKGINILLAKVKNTEGVGSIEPAVRKNRKVHVSNFTSSQNSGFTQHYEVGEFKTKPVIKDGQIIGYNFTGLPGCDISVSDVSKIAKELETNLKEKSRRILRDKERISKEIEKLEVDYKELLDTISKEKNKIPFENYLKGCDEIEKKYSEQKSKLWNEITNLTFKKQNSENELVSIAEALSKKDEIMSDIYWGTSYATPVRTAKLALNDMMAGII